MTMGLIHYGAVLIAIAVLDGVWLGLLMRRFYVDQLGAMMREPVAVLPAAAFYFIYAAGLTILAVLPAERSGGWSSALLLGAAVGFVAYSTYDLTNLSTLKGFPLSLALVDIAWGTAMSALAAYAGYAIPKVFGG